jgi:hypothetical protein
LLNPWGVFQSSRNEERIRGVRAEIAEQHESIMKLLSQCALRFNGIPADIAAALTESVSLPLEEQPEARRAVRDRMLRLLAPNQDDQQNGTDGAGGFAALIAGLKPFKKAPDFR